MKRLLSIAAIALVPVAAHADDSAILQAKTQALMDAVAPGDKAVWIAVLDKRFVMTDETGAVSDYAQSIEQVAPLPKGASGNIKVIDWKAAFAGDVAITTYVDDEHENFHGQKLHALYRSTGTWLHEKGDWKLIGMQTLALRQDPPAVSLPVALLASYVGRYRGGPDYTYTITEKDGRLYGATNDAKPVEIKAEIADVLFTPGAPRTRKLFHRDAKGNVTGFLSRREERDLVFTKET
jgi:Domain of unknown function (DUF4440)